jgi:DNA invertase Pin-like site-specific DNA recombinase
MQKRVACYCRVSTLDQSTGMESQVRVLKQYCELNNDSVHQENLAKKYDEPWLRTKFEKIN